MKELSKISIICGALKIMAEGNAADALAEDCGTALMAAATVAAVAGAIYIGYKGYKNAPKKSSEAPLASQ